MRQITTDASQAFNSQGNFSLSNTRVETKNGTTKMYLFNNHIATLTGKQLTITNAGYKTVTTKERLNGILQAVVSNDVKGMGISQEKGIWYIYNYQYQPVFKTLNKQQWNGNNHVINL